MYKDKDRCLECRYGYFPVSCRSFLEVPMCLYYHDTGKDRDGNDEYCNSFAKITEEERKEMYKNNLRRSIDEFYFPNCW